MRLSEMTVYICIIAAGAWTAFALVFNLSVKIPHKLLTKSDKRFIISLQMNIGIFRNTACAGFARSTEKRGANPRRRNGTVRCECSFRLAQQRGHSRERGRLCGKNGRKPAHQVRIFGSNLHSWLSQRSNVQCIKMFAPRFEKTLVLFYCRNRRERTLPFFTP